MREHDSRVTNLTENVYFELFKKISHVHDADEKHYIFIDEKIESNTKCLVDGINIWILKTHYDLCYFKNADIYFLRGNYLNYYNNFVHNKKGSKILFYPATSINYTYTSKERSNQTIIKQNQTFKKKQVVKNSNAPIDHPFYEFIDTVFIHEDPEYMVIFNKVRNKIIFNKPAANNFKFINLKREYDFIFVGDAIQPTKNHHLMFHFIEYCEKNKIKYNILYVSDKSILKTKIDNFIEIADLNYVSLKFVNYLTPQQMNIYFNQSKINLIFAGRDAFPRTITESLFSGCYNIALDTLSDGKNVINNIFGKVIGDEDGLLKLLTSKSISYENNDILWRQISSIATHTFDHANISLQSRQQYNYENISLQNIK
jgi:hypothetical protein